jgi:cellulose synthase/poly-beta-1,6-N-acetylglucosamine synthase-like glycosyltransferase
MNTLEIIFWCFLFIVFYTYIGYGFTIYILVILKRLFRKKKRITTNNPLPKVTLLIAAYNEANIIDKKMENNFSLNYPSELLDIVFVTDGSTDQTNSIIEKYTMDSTNKPKVILYFDKPRKGKTAAINRVMPMITSTIVVFTDANTMLNNDSIIEIAKAFNDPKVGCVAGEKRVESDNEEGAAASEGLYWKYESILKKLDSELCTTVGAAGELYAIRRELFMIMPENTLLDDFILSMEIVKKGYKIAYCDKAYAMEKASLDIKEEEKRKIRIAAGGLQSIFRLAPLLNIFKYGMASFQYISHRVLRWSITPILLFALLPINILIVTFATQTNILFSILLALQVLFYIGAIIGKYLANHNIKNNIVYVPYYFLFMNFNVLKGFKYLLNNKNTGAWEKAKRRN